MKSFFIGIAGGSGSGKTRLVKELKRYFGRKASILHLDCYQRFGEKLPKIYGMENWECPEAVNWDKLLKDLISLKNGKAIRAEIRDEHKKLKLIGTTILYPTEIIIIEGYLLFCKKSIRDVLDFLIYLKASDKTRIKRRTKFKNDKYERKILLPMHRKYIEPTKRFADLILNTEKYSIKECSNKIIRHLLDRF